MQKKGRGWMLIGLLLVATISWPAYAQVATTTVADTVYSANGAAAQGSVVVSWSAFTTAAGSAVAAGSTSATMGSDGSLSVALAPNAGANPTGSFYTVVFHLSDGTTSRQYWVVPVSSSPVKLSAVQSQVVPASVALQTVSKAYVDHAIQTALLSGGGGTGASPTGTSFIQKSGDAMTGPLVLAADPVSPSQAANKHYVDAGIAAVSGGLAMKLALLPTVNQVVTQPTGTQMEVNVLNGVLDATGFLSGNGGNGATNALASSACTSGCDISVSSTYPGTEPIPLKGLPDQTHIKDHRGGAIYEMFSNPLPAVGNYAVGVSMEENTTRPAAQLVGMRPSAGPNNQVMLLTHNAAAGGVNQFPEDVEQVPFAKSNYGVFATVGNYNTQGQHVQLGTSVNCYAVGDCLAGGQFILSSGGYRDRADEGAHPFDLEVAEDSHVFAGTCGASCSTGATTLAVNPTASGGTQGEGRFLIDKNPSKVISTGSIVGQSADLLPIVNFAGTNFPVSVQMVTAAAATSQGGTMAPGTVTLPLATSGLPAGYAVSTNALPSPTGVACVADQDVFPNFETVKYSVVDATHLQLVLNKVHKTGAVVAVGGLCGYGLEQTADTQTVGSSTLRQIFPVIGSPTKTSLYYAAALTGAVGLSGNASTGAFLNISANVVSATRSGNQVRLSLDRNLPVDLNGLTVNVSGMADSSYNGAFAVSTQDAATLVYTASGADGNSSGGSISFLNGGFALYPMAETLSVYNPATASIDGLFTLAANTVAWAPGDPLEQPHFYQQATYGDTEFITQYVPRPISYASAGKTYRGQLGPGARGWAVVNEVPTSNYIGAGGLHELPYSAFLAQGPWQNSMEVDAGTQSVLRVHCNLYSCNRWDSGYALFSLDRNGGVQDFLNYAPQTSTASWLLGGTTYSFSPSAFTAPTVFSGALKTGANGNAQIAAGGSSGYSNFTLNGNNTDGSRLGFIGGGTNDPNLYLDVPDGGSFVFRFGSNSSLASLLTPAGLRTSGVTTQKLVTGTANNTDLAGVLRVAAGSTASATYSFAGSYGSAPVCLVQPQSITPAVAQAMGGYVPQVTTGSLLVSVASAPSADVLFGYMCTARN